MLRKPRWPLHLACVLAVVGCARPQRHVVEIRGFDFHPQTVSAAVGDTIVFINRDVVPHTATSQDGVWASESLAAGASWLLVVTGDSAQSYLCTLHPAMRGRIAVQ